MFSWVKRLGEGEVLGRGFEGSEREAMCLRLEVGIDLESGAWRGMSRMNG